MGDRRLLLEPDHPDLSIRRQCEILDINRSSVYYTQQMNEKMNVLQMHMLNHLAIAAEIVEEKMHVVTKQIKT